MNQLQIRSRSAIAGVSLLMVVLATLGGVAIMSYRHRGEAYRLADDSRYASNLSEARIQELLQISDTQTLRSFEHAPRAEFEHLVVDLLRKYPFESIRSRLAPLKPRKEFHETALSNESREELDDFEWVERYEPVPIAMRKHDSLNSRRLLNDSRGILLKQLHEGTVEDFVNQNGVGVYRVMRVYDEEYNRSHPLFADHRPTELPCESESAAEPRLSPLNADELKKAHRLFRDSFVFEEGWGYVRSKDEVAGFIAHRVGSVPLSPWTWQINGQHSPDQTRDEWRIASVKLVSLLKHPSPQVYELEKLPDMADVKNAPTRALSPWEAASLDSLVAGENVCIENLDSRIQMFGAIRANKECLQCHEVKRGDLLGAFTYEIVPHSASQE